MSNVLAHGVSESTSSNMLLGAGTIHKNLKYDNSEWNFKESLYAATSGGNKLTITPNIVTPEIDGVLVKAKGLDFKVGETAKLELNLAELNASIIEASVLGKIVESGSDDHDLIESKPSIESSDYVDNIAFVGKTTGGKPIIVILDNAICTTGLELEGKKSELGVTKQTWECTADITSDLNQLPYHIYYPKKVATPAVQKGETNE